MPNRYRVLPLTLAVLAFSNALAAQPQATPEWDSGFENGFPGEFTDFDEGSYSADGDPVPGRGEAWTIVGREDPVVMAGDFAYKGWPTGPATEDVRRAYPVLHTDVPSPCVNSFLIYLDLDFSQVSATEWVHVATYANNPDWVVFTMSVRDGRLEMAHLDWAYVGPGEQPEFPLRQWVRITTYLEFNGDEAITHVWQDGVHIFEGTYTGSSGTSLMRAHWGWYSSAAWDEGVEYNDEIQIWSLSEPLTDFTEEPPSPYGMGGDGGTGGGTSNGGTSNGGTSNGGTSNGGTGNGGTGNGGTGNGGTSNGGTSAGGAAGSVSQGGSEASGGASSGGAGGRDGTSGTPSGGTTAGSAGDPIPSAAPDEEGGCSCRVAESTRGTSSSWLAAGVFGLLLLRRRR